ncbi:MAG: thiamine diphosphokinase [Lachnospiraceae bacterium]|nr:thiamine diphosphokinase [Lachnospiraceae bacterium]
MKRCVIAGGADIADHERIRRLLEEDDFMIYCDSGLKHMKGLMRKPGLIVGDFDSAEDPHMDVETITLPCEKDDTDTVFAVKEAVKRGYDDILLIGVCGGRLDHTLGNISILLYLDSLGKKGRILDDYSEMELVSDREVTIDDRYSFFSLINISGCAEGVTIRNAKYPLEDAVITTQYQYGISNEVLKGKKATVSVKKGNLLLIKVS